MKQIALLFAHNDQTAIDAVVKCLVLWTEEHNTFATVRFTIVLAPSLVTTYEGKYPAVGVRSITAFQKNLFTEVINCSNILLDVLPTQYQSVINKKLNDVVNPAEYHLERGLVFESIFNACDGYGSSAQNIAIELSKQDIDFSFHPCTTGPSARQLAAPEVVNNIKRFPLGGFYLQYSVPVLTPQARLNISSKTNSSVFTMFEATRIPALWPSVINRFDRLIVPSTFCKNVFVECGVTVPTHVVPLGVVPEQWPVYKDRSKSTAPFRFLLFANSHWDNTRKNYALSLNLFKRLFSGNRNVQLVLKLTEPADIPPNLPNNVKVLVGRYDQPQLIQLLHSCDCLLFPSNGEGFGLPPREAMATGMTCIYTNWGGLTDLADRGVGYPVNNSGEQVAVYPDGYVQGANNGSPFVGNFARQNTEALAAKMKWVVNHRDQVIEQGLRDAVVLRKQETYVHTVNNLLRAIKMVE